MKPKEYKEKGEIKIVGIEARISNKDGSASESEIPELWGRFFKDGVSARIGKPGAIVALYSEYEDDYRGAYTLTLGQEVGEDFEVPEGLVVREVPASKYALYRTKKGQMPGNVIEIWEEIWKTEVEEMGGERTYKGDMEVYDDRAINPMDAEVDVYIAIS